MNKTPILLAFVIFSIIAGGVLWFLRSMPDLNVGGNPPLPSPAPSADTNKANPAPEEKTNTKKIITQGKLSMEILKEGTGEGAKAGDRLTVHYTGKLQNGTVFDSSIPRGQPFQFTIGGGQVIKGWDQGLIGMKVGEKRNLTIPPELGYGARGTPGGPIPPNATLIFEVELLKIN